MGLKQDLETINTKTKEILSESNNVLIYPAETMSELPQMIDITRGISETNGYESGYQTGYDVGYGNGVQTAVDHDKIVEATASGVDMVVIDDVSEVNHDVTVEVDSKNWANLSNPINTYRAEVVSRTENTVTLKTTATGSKWNAVYYLLSEELVGKTLTISATWEASNASIENAVRIQWINASKVVVGSMLGYINKSGQAQTFTVTEKPADATDLAIILYAVADSTNAVAGDTVTYSNVQLEVGTTATPYTPYVDVSPAKVRVSGKNLANKDEFVEYPTVRKYLPLKLKAGTYYYSSNLHTASGAVFYTGIVPDGEVSNANNIVLFSGFATSQDEGSFTVPKSGTYRFLIYCADADKKAALDNTWDSVWLQIEIGNTKTDYEPYKGKEYELGETVKSICPTMYVTTDADGVNIDVHYRKSWGKQVEYDAFWNAFQQNGNRQSYLSGFSGHGWTDETFKPKHNMTPTRADQMFIYSHIKDVKGALERQGVTLDTSQSTQLNSIFQECWVEIAPVIDTTSCSSPNNLFANCQFLRIVELVILRDDGTQTVDNICLNCNLLEEIRFAGKFGKNVSFAQSTKLSRASIESVIAALSPTKTGYVTFSQAAVDKAYETSEGANDGITSEEWTNIAANTPWGVNLE